VSRSTLLSKGHPAFIFFFFSPSVVSAIIFPLSLKCNFRFRTLLIDFSWYCVDFPIPSPAQRPELALLGHHHSPNSYFPNRRLSPLLVPIIFSVFPMGFISLLWYAAAF